MTTPFIDPALIVTALATLLEATGDTPPMVRDIRLLGDADRASPGQLVRRLPGIAVVSVTSSVSRESGVPYGFILTENIDLILQSDHLDGHDETALSTLRSMRGAVFNLLEAKRPAPNWAPLRYQGGKLLTVDNSVWTWTERYSTEYGVPTKLPY